MKLLMLVNGEPEGAEGSRARALAGRMPAGWTVALHYRTARTVGGIVQFARALVKMRPDVTCVVKCAFSGVLAAWVGRLLVGSPYVCDTGDAVYELARSTGRYSYPQLLLIRIVEWLGTKKADAVVVRGSFHKELLERQGVANVTFIPDGIEATSPAERDPALARELGLDGSFVAGMVGSMEWSQRYQMCYGWDLIEALPFLADVPVKVLLVGDGDGRARLEQRAAELGVSERVRFVGRQPFDQLPQYLALMDVCVSTQSADVVGMVRTTGKLPLYLAHGKHVISTNSGEARRVLPGVGSLLPYEGVRDDAHPQRLAERIRQLSLHADQRGNPVDAQTVALREFDYPVLAERFATVCESVARRKKTG